MLHHSLQGWLTPAVAGLAIFATASHATAQRNQAERERAQRPETQRPETQRPEARRGEVQALTIPSAELLRLTADMPTEIRAGEQFSYRVTVSNQSDNVTLHNVQIEQKPASSVSVQSARMQGQQPREQQPQAEQPREQQPQRDQQQDQVQQQAQAQQQAQDKNRWTIDQLAPGESRTIEVQATGNEQGQADTCFMITSYTPALCVTTKVVEPQLELTKNAPEQINICEPLKYEYTVKNPGTGDLEAFIVRDELPEGIETESGKKNLEFRLDDGLKAGETRQFVANLVATKAGSFSSPATASSADGELQNRSRAPETRVVQTELAVAVDGDRRVYGRQTVNFTARITNTGDAPAENVMLAVNLPEQARLVDIGQMRMSDDQVQPRRQQGQPTPAENEQDQQTQVQQQQQQQEQEQEQQQDQEQEQQQEPSQQQQQQQQQQQMATAEEMRIDRLEPGQTIAFEFAVRPQGLEEIKTEVVAMHRCAGDRDRDRAMARSVATATTRVVLLPDLMVSLVDNEGTVPQGSEVTYFLTVRNQGDAAAKNIEASVELPEELELVDARGPSEAERSEGSLTFAPVEQLEPDQQVRWIITAKATGEGEIRVNAKVSSQDLERPVNTEEPTVLLGQDEPSQDEPDAEQSDD